LVPLSFVADWWCNVGDWISAAIPDPNIQTLTSWTTVITTTTTSTETFRSNTAPVYNPVTRTTSYVSNSGSGGSDETIGTSVKRVASVTLPHLPVANLNVDSLSHALSALALTSQRISKLFKLLAR
jgi:hypothetical protein